ncbi:MAG TPA: response regulator [Phycisphaerae bacterium]|nr:response regulator [Phycisphaerae bacterium]
MPEPAILLADDDPHFRKAAARRLHAWGFGVVECADGVGAIARAAAGVYDAIILDQMMPAGDGLSIVARLRERTDAAIIFVSGCERERFRQAVLAARDVYYLPKPVDFERLRELLDTLIPKAGTRPAGAAECGTAATLAL